jgi:hypothetical protein
MKNTIKNWGILAIAVGLGACGKYNYPPEVTDELMKSNEYVYGKVGGAPKQTANTYPADPDIASKAADLRQKLFYNDWNLPTGEKAKEVIMEAQAADGAATTDTTAKK